jgi:hypothetical protein
MSALWTAEEGRLAHDMALARTPTVHIAHRVRRTEKSVIHKLRRLGVPEASINIVRG